MEQDNSLFKLVQKKDDNLNIIRFNLSSGSQCNIRVGELKKKTVKTNFVKTINVYKWLKSCWQFFKLKRQLKQNINKNKWSGFLGFNFNRETSKESKKDISYLLQFPAPILFHVEQKESK